MALGSGITNHNVRGTFGETEAVLRIAGRDTDLLGIDRAAEHVATRLEIAPDVLAFPPEQSCLLTRFVHAEPIGNQALRGGTPRCG